MSPNSRFKSFAARLREVIGLAIREPEFGVPALAQFNQMALELFALQFEHNAPYRRLCQARGVLPRSVEHWSQIPPAPTAAFKEFELSCLPPEERRAVFHSSGTSQQRPSRHFHNAQSLALYELSLWSWFCARAIPGACCPADLDNTAPSGAPFQLAILTPLPAQAPHSSLVHMFETIRRRLGVPESAFVGQADGDGVWMLDLEAAVALLRRAADSRRPLLLLGTAFLFVHLLDHLAERNLQFALPPGSWALETGGYKGRSRSLPKAELHSLITARLGLPPAHILCEYGMSELSSQAYEGPEARVEGDKGRVSSDGAQLRHAPRTTHHAPRFTFHVSRPTSPFLFPPWARAQIVSPETGREAGEGETGLIRVFDLANVYSVLAIQTEDLGIRRGDGFELVGRAALAEPRGCSLMAV